MHLKYHTHKPDTLFTNVYGRSYNMSQTWTTMDQITATVPLSEALFTWFPAKQYREKLPENQLIFEPLFNVIDDPAPTQTPTVTMPILPQPPTPPLPASFPSYLRNESILTAPQLRRNTIKTSAIIIPDKPPTINITQQSLRASK